MIHRRQFLGVGAVGAVAWLAGCAGESAAEAQTAYRFRLTDAQWRARLSPAAYQTLRHEATERPGSSLLNEEHRRGTFSCAGCNQALFSSTTKFDSGTGWPSFYRPLAGAIGTKTDRGFGESRTEVHCSNCGGHLGHVFNDGPPPTGLRYCMNGVAMTFRAA